ncbi:TipAS antibiotic-recognition domain-containing protein [Nesterenkonia massiliensis]|uniref:TipAS antibiotic-recognition domain-containing protein n=1 Tax=Nesterenkonia massiliensis TaxID=1232429 RepID=A0ABT2HS42_9MICC|nr:TipAS antibiotic-recognition domain-containing protein [Nesterenkonia massiliensis]MCT1607510.1 TipAS antibiotic-recognition domain-containing protein [Nesterenkonia massiliensis]
MSSSAQPQRQEWSIQEIARITGTTSRTLRHYHQQRLLEPSRIGHQGYRYYDAAALLRLQRILLLRELGLGLPAIREALSASNPQATEADRQSHVRVLRTHLQLLKEEQQRLARQIASVQHTISTVEKGGELVAEDMFDGFDHTIYQREVSQRWGADAWQHSNTWWEAKTGAERQTWMTEVKALNTAWVETWESGAGAASPRAQDLAARHVQWLSSVPGTPAAAGGEQLKEYVLGLADLYVSDARFAANYGGTQGAEFVREALANWVQNNC